jgi:hypothetical protein
MSYLKMLGLVAAAALALTALVGAGTASAAGGVLCEEIVEPCEKGNEWLVNAHMTFALKAGTKAKLTTTGGATLLECGKSGLTGKVLSAGTKAENAKVEVKKEWLTWEECSHPFSTATPGELEFEYRKEPETKGTVFAKGFVLTGEILGLHCSYKIGANPDIGLYTPGAAGKDGIIAVSTTLEKENSAAHPSLGLCPAKLVFHAEYTLTTNTALYIKGE